MIMKKIFIILLLFITCFNFSSQILKTDFVAAYNVEYPIYNKKNAEQFLLFINSKENTSFYRSTNQYILDSLKAGKEINNDDFTASTKYTTALGEEVLKKGNTFTVYETIVDAKVKYKESADLKWTVLNDTKTYAGYKTRKAYTIAYGRKWIAWYTDALPLNFGPYKFCGLPGLIINMYDENGQYYFTLSVFKRKSRLASLPKDKRYKLVSKAKAKQIKYNTLSDLSGMIFDDPNMKRRMEQSNQKRIKESPQLDIEK